MSRLSYERESKRPEFNTTEMFEMPVCDLNFTRQNTNKLSVFFRQTIENKYIKYRGESYHPYHFQCTNCQFVEKCTIFHSTDEFTFFRTNLDENTREVHGSLYCVSCYNKLDLPVCAACRCMIDDRVISALGKQWHVEVFLFHFLFCC